MRTIKLTIQYDGTDFHGWQVQPSARTVQQVLQEALSTVCDHPVVVHGSGRTDAGVHALGQVAHFTTGSRIEPAQLQNGLNALLPEDAAIVDAVEVAEGFHARFDATRRTYWYVVMNTQVASPLYRRFAWHIRKELDLGAMRAAAGVLVGTHDFSSFQTRERDDVCSVRQVQGVSVKRVNASLLLFEIRATSFLRHMVRGIMGTLVEAGLGKMSAADMKDILQARDRSLAGATAPPHGLFLKEVCYD